MILNCPECGKRLRVRDELAGKRGKCPGCGAVLRVPEVPIAVDEAMPRTGSRVLRGVLPWIAGGVVAAAVLVFVLVFLIGRRPSPPVRSREGPVAEDTVEETAQVAEPSALRERPAESSEPGLASREPGGPPEAPSAGATAIAAPRTATERTAGEAEGSVEHSETQEPSLQTEQPDGAVGGARGAIASERGPTPGVSAESPPPVPARPSPAPPPPRVGSVHTYCLDANDSLRAVFSVEVIEAKGTESCRMQLTFRDYEDSSWEFPPYLVQELKGIFPDKLIGRPMLLLFGKQDVWRVSPLAGSPYIYDTIGTSDTPLARGETAGYWFKNLAGERAQDVLRDVFRFLWIRMLPAKLPTPGDTWEVTVAGRVHQSIFAPVKYSFTVKKVASDGLADIGFAIVGKDEKRVQNTGELFVTYRCSGGGSLQYDVSTGTLVHLQYQAKADIEHAWAGWEAHPTVKVDLRLVDAAAGH